MSQLGGTGVVDVEPHRVRFETSPGVVIVGDEVGSDSRNPVILLHGGGQVRQAWAQAQRGLALQGFRSLALDQRGHGESSWAPDGDYSIDAFAHDLRAVVRHVGGRPALVGASLGGLISMTVLGEGGAPSTAALVLVDVTHRLEPSGALKIHRFMRANPDGFDSIDHAADAVARYLPHRRRAKNLEGMRRNLRLKADGRWRWHWDPRFLDADGGRAFRHEEARFRRALTRVQIPTLLVRGGRSEIVSDRGVEELQCLLPHCEYTNIPRAAHMVAGDDNDTFSRAIIGFLSRVLHHG